MNGAILYSGVAVGRECEIGHHVVIRDDSTMGDRCYAKCGAVIDPSCKIGNDVILAGLVGARSTIGNGVTMLGMLVHKSTGPHRGAIENGPSLEDNVFVGRGAVVVGSITIHTGATIAANATVLADVPPGAVITGVWRTRGEMEL